MFGRCSNGIGYDVDAVANGHDAITSFEQKPYAVVLMDCQMPTMDGLHNGRGDP